MSLFARFLNPLWKEIKSLEVSRQLDLCNLILLPGFVRKTINDELVTPFEKLCSVSDDRALRSAGKPIVPIPLHLRERLVDEAAVALLACSARRDDHDGLKHFAPSVLPDAVGVLILAEINERLHRDRPATLEEAGYSSQPDEARTQLLLTWMRILGLTNAAFPGVVSAVFFQGSWATMSTSLVGGALLGMSRVEPRLIIARAEGVCSTMPRQGQAGIRYLIGTI